MIIQENNLVTIDQENPSILVVNSFTFENIRIKKQAFDLSEYQGKPFRLYVEKDGEFSADIDRSHYWLLLEVIVPEKKFDMVTTGILDEKGQMQTKCIEVALDLNHVDIYVFQLPEVLV